MEGDKNRDGGDVADDSGGARLAHRAVYNYAFMLIISFQHVKAESLSAPVFLRLLFPQELNLPGKAQIFIYWEFRSTLLGP